MFGNQYPNNTLGQSSMNPKGKTVENAPDTDSRLIKIINGASTVAPNLMWDHTRLEYIVPTSNLVSVSFTAPINAEDRSLHYFVLDNSNGGGDKTFTFSSDYIFLDDVGNNSYVVAADKKLVFFGVFMIKNGVGKMNFRVSSESTN